MRTWRRWLLAMAVMAVLLVVVITNRDEARHTIDALRHASPGWIAGAILALVLWWISWTMTHLGSAVALRHGHYRQGFSYLVPSVAATGVNFVVKSGGLAGIGLFTAQARRRGRSTTQAKGSYVLATAIVDAAFVVVLTAGLVAVAINGKLSSVEVLAAGVFVALLLVRVVAFLFAVRDRNRLRWMWAVPTRILAALRRRPAAPIDTTEVDELFDAVQLVRARPSSLVVPVTAAVLIDVLAVAMMWCAIGAVTGESHPDQALVAYAISSLFVLVSVVPGGIGLAEVGVAATLSTYGVPVAQAAAIAIIFRAFEFWLPVLIGLLTAAVFLRDATTNETPS